MIKKYFLFSGLTIAFFSALCFLEYTIDAIVNHAQLENYIMFFFSAIIMIPLILFALALGINEIKRKTDSTLPSILLTFASFIAVLVEMYYMAKNLKGFSEYFEYDKRAGVYFVMIYLADVMGPFVGFVLSFLSLFSFGQKVETSSQVKPSCVALSISLAAVGYYTFNSLFRGIGYTTVYDGLANNTMKGLAICLLVSSIIMIITAIPAILVRAFSKKGQIVAAVFASIATIAYIVSNVWDIVELSVESRSDNAITHILIYTIALSVAFALIGIVATIGSFIKDKEKIEEPKPIVSIEE